MSGDDIARLLYLALLGVAIAGALLVGTRQSLGRIAQQAAIWGLIFLGAIAVIGLWQDIRRAAAPVPVTITADTIIVPIAPDGHFYIPAEVNGADILFMVDTGASDIVLTREDARQAGLAPDALDYRLFASTANGTVRIAPVRLQSLTVGEVTDINVPAMVNGGELETSLLGMSWLGRFELTLTPDRLVLKR